MVLIRISRGGGGGVTGRDIAARVFKSTPQTITHVTLAVVSFDSEDYDSSGMHDNAVNNSRITCQEDGKYLCILNLAWESSSVGQRDVNIRLNGVTDISGGVYQSAFGSEWSVSVEIDMVIGDFIEATAFQNTGGDLDIRTDITSLSMRKIDRAG